MNALQRCLLTSLAAAVLMAPIWGQSVERKADLTGDGGYGAGRCTIEVEVDGSADIAIRGDLARLRTLSGKPAHWRRFACSGPMPANPSEFRLSSGNGRRNRELIQDPRSGRGEAVVRIHESDRDAQAYTFDLVWRTGAPNDALAACTDAVRESASQRYGLSDLYFKDLSTGDNTGHQEIITGSFDVSKDPNRDGFRFSCAFNLAYGKVWEVDIYPGLDAATADRYAVRDDAAPACQRAAEQRIRGGGYRNVQFGWLNVGNRRSDRIAVTATAQWGDNGRDYAFDIRCAVNPNNGGVSSVRVNRQ